MGEEALKAIVQEFVNKVVALLQTQKEEAKSSEASSAIDKDVLLELVSHEGIVKEAYKDSKGIWTWGIGVTDASGHRVLRYKDNPQPVSKVIEIFKWLVETKYLPDVLEAFEGVELTKKQLAAALSFHYNTGAIKRATWVKSFKEGKIAQAKREFMNWKNPPEIIGRRTKERDLFFDGKWSNNGTATVFEKVRKPSYVPNWSSAKKVDISKELI